MKGKLTKEDSLDFRTNTLICKPLSNCNEGIMRVNGKAVISKFHLLDIETLHGMKSVYMNNLIKEEPVEELRTPDNIIFSRDNYNIVGIVSADKTRVLSFNGYCKYTIEEADHADFVKNCLLRPVKREDMKAGNIYFNSVNDPFNERQQLKRYYIHCGEKAVKYSDSGIYYDFTNWDADGWHEVVFE